MCPRPERRAAEAPLQLVPGRDLCRHRLADVALALIDELREASLALRRAAELAERLAELAGSDA